MCRFLGSVAVALFVSYAVQGKEVREWGEGLLHTLHTAKEYCKQQERDWKEIEENWIISGMNGLSISIQSKQLISQIFIVTNMTSL